MSDNRLVVHHVGGRAGSRSFPVLPAFERDIINVMYDADERCLAQVMEIWKTQPSKTIVLPYCLSARDGVSKFHINYDPYTSSIYPLNPRYAQFYYTYPGQGYDYVLGDTFRTVREVQLPTTTLDAVVLDRSEAPGPDFLSIDTQGSELDILIGSLRLLDTTILAVHAEVELHPLYEGQPLFGDICQFLAKHDFDLVDIQLFSKLLPIRGKHGFRGVGYAAHGEALFLKRPEAVTNSVQLNKLAFIAATFGQFECAQQCFDSIAFERMAALQNPATDQQPQYLDFVSRLAGTVASLPQRSVPLFSDVYSCAQSEARFQTQTQTSRRSLLGKYLRTITPLVFAVRVLRTLRQRLYTLRISAMIRAYGWFKRSGSPVEALFLEFGMTEQYLLAMRNRILDSQVRPGSTGTSP